MQYANRHTATLVFPNKARQPRYPHPGAAARRSAERPASSSSTVHALRHSFGAHLRMAGVSLADIGDLLGHKDLATTQIYAKVQQEHLRAVISKLTPLSRKCRRQRQLPRAASRAPVGRQPDEDR